MTARTLADWAADRAEVLFIAALVSGASMSRWRPSPEPVDVTGSGGTRNQLPK